MTTVEACAVDICVSTPCTALGAALYARGIAPLCRPAAIPDSYWTLIGPRLQFLYGTANGLQLAALGLLWTVRVFPAFAPFCYAEHVKSIAVTILSPAQNP